MTASTTKGRPLPELEWKRVDEAAELVFELENERRNVSAACPVLFFSQR
jgi:hypothetical protein